MSQRERPDDRQWACQCWTTFATPSTRHSLFPLTLFLVDHRPSSLSASQIRQSWRHLSGLLAFAARLDARSGRHLTKSRIDLCERAPRPRRDRQALHTGASRNQRGDAPVASPFDCDLCDKYRVLSFAHQLCTVAPLT